MTKEMIIDGVDVSECEHNAGKLCSMTREACCYCSAKPNCMYKRLKRKEQECEELNKTITNLESIRDVFSTKLDQLNAELEQEKALKETYHACYKAKHEDIKGELFKLREENWELKRELMQYEKDVKDLNYFAMKLKAGLDRIKEIAEENIRIADLEGLDGVYRRGLAEQILQKISECEVEDDR